jgi:hypothetical protein
VCVCVCVCVCVLRVILHNRNDYLQKFGSAFLGSWMLGVGVISESKKFTFPRRAAVAHAYSPSYSGGRDQEDPGLKPA